MKFIEFTKVTEDFKDNERLVGKAIINFFYGGNEKDMSKKIDEFSRALMKDSGKPLRYKLHIDVESNAGRFIDLENYSEQDNLEELLKLLLKPKYWFQSVDVHKLSLEEANFVLQSFINARTN